MKTNGNGKTLSLGTIVEKLFDQAGTLASDGAAAADIAARRLEEVLTRGANARLAAALSNLALELAPAPAYARVPRARGAYVSSRAA